MLSELQHKVDTKRQALSQRAEVLRDRFSDLCQREQAAAIPTLSRDAELQRMLSRRIAFAQDANVAYSGLPDHLRGKHELA